MKGYMDNSSIFIASSSSSSTAHLREVLDTVALVEVGLCDMYINVYLLLKPQ